MSAEKRAALGGAGERFVHFLRASLASVLLLSPPLAQAVNDCHPYRASSSSGGPGIWGYSALEVCQKLAAGPQGGWWSSRFINGGRDYRTVTVLGLTPVPNVSTSWYCHVHQEVKNVETGVINPEETGEFDRSGAVRDDEGCQPIVETIKTQPGLSCSRNPGVAKPIFPLTGAERFTQPVGLTIGWLNLSLTYDTTHRLPAGQAMQPDFPKLRFTSLVWETNIHRRIFPGHKKKTAYALRGSHVIVTFNGDGQDNYTADPDINDRLVVLKAGADITGYQYHDVAANAIESYDANGYLTRIDRHDGDFLVFTNSTARTAVAPAAGYLMSVQDARGRAIQFEYHLSTVESWDGLLTKIIDPAGQPILLGYDGFPPKLVKVTWQGEATDPNQRPYRRFLYDNPRGPSWAMSGIEDENRALHASITYDSLGRATSSELAGGVNRYSVAYAQPPEVLIEDSAPVPEGSAEFIYRTRTLKLPAGTVVTLPNGTTSKWSAELRNGAPALTSRSQPAGAGCNESTSSQTFDDNGNVTSLDDFNGHRTCYAYDTKNQESTRVEGLGGSAVCSAYLASGAALAGTTRKVNTQWHPHWRLPTKVAEPLKLTTYVYNGQSDPITNAVVACAPDAPSLPGGKPAVLCKKIEQATTDTNGSQGLAATLDLNVPARTWSYRYDQHGQILTETDPASNVTTYTYYPADGVDYRKGDLQSIKPPLIPATQFTKYNAAGQVLQSIDAAGVTTNYEYDLRQRLLSSTVVTASSNLKTSYEWHPTGLLKKAIQPNGSFVEYFYDDAHRLTSVKDQLGNTISYAYDAMGNRKAETVKDSGNALARQVARTFDALSRLQTLRPGAAQ